MNMISRLVNRTLEERVAGLLEVLVPPTKSAKLLAAEKYRQGIRNSHRELDERGSRAVVTGSPKEIARLERESENFMPVRRQAEARLREARSEESGVLLASLKGPHEEARLVLGELLNQFDLVATALRDIQNFASANAIEPPGLIGVGATLQATARHMKALIE